MRTKRRSLVISCCVLILCGCVSQPRASNLAREFQRQSHIFSDDLSDNLKSVRKIADAVIYLQRLLDVNAEHGFPEYVVYVEASLLKECEQLTVFPKDPFAEIKEERKPETPVITRMGGRYMSAAEAFTLFCDMATIEWRLDGHRVLISRRINPKAAE